MKFNVRDDMENLSKNSKLYSHQEKKSGTLHEDLSIIIIFYYAMQPLRLIVRSWLDVPTFATRLLHACHHARAPSGGR